MPVLTLPDDPAHFHAILAALPGNFIVMLPDAPTYTIVAMSAELLRQTDREADQVVGQSVFVAYPENEAEVANNGPAQMRTALDACLRDQQPHELPLVRYDVPTPEGRFEERYWSGRSQAILDARGQVLYLLFTSVDLTAQRRAEHEQQARQQAEQRNRELEARVQERTRQVHEQGQRLERLFTQAPAAICILSGPELVYELVNPIYQQFFPGRHLLGKPLREALPELADHAAYHTMRHVFDTGETVWQQALHAPLARTVDGVLEDRYFNYIQQPRYDEQGRIDGVLVFGFEVTELVQTQQRAEALQAQVLAAAQHQAEQRETFYRIFEETPAAICIQRGPQHRYEYVNVAYQAFFPGRAFLGRPVVEVLPETVDSGVVALLDHVYQTGETYYGEELPLLIAQPQGPPKQMYFTFTYQALHENGQIVGISTFAYDVAEQVLARQRLLESAQQVRALIEGVPFPINVCVGEDFRIELANHAMLAAWGKGSAVFDRPFADVLPELEHQGIVAQFNQVVASGEPLHQRNQRLEVVMNGTPQTFYYNYSFVPLRDTRGQVYGILNTAHDVTDLALARQRIEAYAAELQESEARFRTMADAAPTLVWAVHPDASVRYINRAFLDFVGLRTEQQYAATGWGPYIHPDELALTQQTLTQAIAQRVPYVLEHRLRRHDGQHRWLLSQGAPSYYPNGELYGYVGSAIDITELKQVNEQLRRTNADLDNFIYTASHDLKAPIANIEGLLRVLEDQLPAPIRAQDEVQPILDLMQASVERFRNTIAHLTDLSKLQQEQELVRELVDVAAVVEDVRRDLELELTKAGAQLHVDVAACPHVRFSVKNLRSVIYNLLSNALKYRHPDRVPLIEVKCTSVAGGRQHLTVHDNGLGLTRTQQQQLFRMFQRLHTHVEGTGIGLYMIKKMVENAGGTLTVESEVGVGSTFTVALLS